MESRVRIFGHPLHQILVMFPIGALGFSVVSDVLHSASRRREHADAARNALTYSLVSGALAMPFGALDWMAVDRGTRAKRVGALHGLGNLAAVGLFAASRVLRTRGKAPARAKWLSGAGMLLSGFTAWLGTELVNRHGIGLQDEIGQDLPSSLAAVGGKPIAIRGSDVQAGGLPVDVRKPATDRLVH